MKASHPVDFRDQLIQEQVAGCTFADVGGLWGTVNEKVSVAAAAGACGLAMVDVTPEGTEWWVKFHERLVSLKVHGCRFIAADVTQLARQPNHPVFDVVHCSGVLYHHPEPIHLISALRQITRKSLILTSAITQERVKNEFGTFEIPASGVLFVPALTEDERRILFKYWADHAGVQACYGISEPVKWNLNDYGPWWYLPTSRTLTAMAECCGFRQLAAQPTWNGDAQTLLLEVN